MPRNRRPETVTHKGKTFRRKSDNRYIANDGSVLDNMDLAAILRSIPDNSSSGNDFGGGDSGGDGGGD
jgi:hypothetical protein